MDPVAPLPADISTLLPHLTPCPRCDSGFVTVPILCNGLGDPDNLHRWYEHCIRNVPQKDRPQRCTYYRWLDDRERGKPPKGAPRATCKGWLCVNAGRSQAVNMGCMFGLCKSCCGYTHHKTAGLRRCAVGEHQKAAGQSYADVQSPPRSPQSPSHQHSHSSGDEPQRDAEDEPPRRVTRKSTAQSREKVDNKVKAAGSRSQRRQEGSSKGTRAKGKRKQSQDQSHDQQRPVEKEYALSVTPSYDHRLVQSDLESVRKAEQALQLESIAAEQKKSVSLTWWTQNDEMPIYADVVAPFHPWFHPKDSPHCVQRFNADTAFFQFFDKRRYRWIEQSSSSPRLNVLLVGDLLFRSEGVTHGPGMPLSLREGTKRAASSPPSLSPPATRLDSPPLVLSASGTPSRMARTPQTSRARLPTPKTRRTLSPEGFPPPTSHSGRSTPGSFASGSDWGNMTFPSTSVPPSPTHSRSSSFSERNLAYSRKKHSSPSLSWDFEGPVSDPVPEIARLPSLLASHAAPPPAHTARESSDGPSTSHTSSSSRPLDLSAAPRGSSKSGWPWRYVCDMHAGFMAYEKLLHEGVDTSIAFSTAFPGHTPKRATLNENWNIWLAGRDDSQAMARWVAHGRTPSGLWKAFRKVYERRSRR
ncbi:hypothetical protein C8Q76DRAFT_792842 [Earliella scabrosa]|nr:hypothetical protein C8Q76DRAFT_792842 [Earliella scabrosa]